MSDSPKKIKLTADPDEIVHILKAVWDSLNTAKQPWFQRFIFNPLKTINEFWFLAILLAFFISVFFFKADLFYPFKKWASISKETNSQLVKYEFTQKLAQHYVKSGNRLLNVDKFGDAEDAFKNALACDPVSKDAEFGIAKSQQLSFSINKEFDPQVIAERINSLKALQDSNTQCAHVIYAEARLKNAVSANTACIIELLNKAIDIDTNYAAAYNLLGLSYLKQRRYDSSTIFLKKACAKAPYNTDYLVNLASVYELYNKIDTAYNLLRECVLIDRENFNVWLEILRFNAIYFLNFDYVKQTAASIIKMFEQDSLQISPKNYDVELTYSLADSGSAKIKSWAAKRAYCLQLETFSRYLKSLSFDGSAALNILNKLKEIWDSAGNEKQVLPLLFMNDLNSFATYDTALVQPIKRELKIVYQFAQRQTIYTVLPIEF